VTKLQHRSYPSTVRIQGIPGDTTEMLLDRVEVRPALARDGRGCMCARMREREVLERSHTRAMKG
jgi:hypothetical protein